jgi:hypothetical protein
MIGHLLLLGVQNTPGELYGLIGLLAGTIAILTYGLLGVAQLGFFRRAHHLIVAEYHEFDADSDSTDGHTARFALRLHNRGSRPISFLGFEFLYPRLGTDTFAADGSFQLNGGARLHEEGVAHGLLPSRQEFALIDRLARTLTLEAHTSRTELFDASLDDASPAVLVFHDSAGLRYHADADGIHPGRYEYPHQAACYEALGVSGARPALDVRQSLLSRRMKLSERHYRSH